jgi:PAS domain S-box-containing protein
VQNQSITWRRRWLLDCHNLRKVNEPRGHAIWIAAIIAVSALLGMLVDWRAPGIERYTRDWLMQVRGQLPPPDDIAIVAIDEPSIARFGRFPWPRSLAARAVDAIAAMQPKVIALDVLYVDPTSESEDSALAKSIARAGNVVVAAQLDNAPVTGGPVAWLMPLPPVAQAAAAIGHVNVSTEAEGVARQLLIRAADDSGRTLRAMAVEAVRVGDRTPEQSITDGPHAVLLGSRVIPTEQAAPSVVIAGPAHTLRPNRMAIDYIGPAGSFAPYTYSMAEVLDGRIPAGSLRGKYVLVGATAASLGDRVASPFVHSTDVRGNQHGSLMPGVEVLANALNTILRSRFYSAMPDLAAFLFSALVAAATLGLLTLAQGRHELLKQMGVLAGMAAGIVVIGYVFFARFLIFPPLTPGLVSFASAGILGLLRRSLVTSARLDFTIAELARGGSSLGPDNSAAGAAESIARLTGAPGVTILGPGEPGQTRVMAKYGAEKSDRYENLTVPLVPGTLIIGYVPGHRPSGDTLRLAAAIASAAAQTAGASVAGADPSWWRLPRGADAKTRMLARLNRRILARARFFDSALRSVEDGLMIAAADGCITLVNRRAAEFLNSSEDALIGRSLFERLADAEGGPAAAEEPLSRLILDRSPIEREITIRGVRARRFILRMAAVSEGDNARGAVLGIVASLSDITRQHDLQQTKNDVMALVSHEMRTPLAAIQGMSELLAQYDLDAGRRREMNMAINDEAKRLTRMITEYLDITRLESGVTVLRRSAVRVESLVERSLLMLDPLAAQKNIRLARKFDASPPAVLADPDLLARAISNLVSNAIKYSPAGSEVTVSVRSEQAGVAIDVADQGPGIPAGDLDRIFEKFYRVPRVEDADTPGTGLGLALVREVAELHGGAVSVASPAGAGSIFTLRIPKMEESHGTLG